MLLRTGPAARAVFGREVAMHRLLKALGLGGAIGRLLQGHAHDGSGLKDSSQVLALFVNSVEDYAIFMLDAEGRIASWNRGAERIKGYAASEVLGRHFSIFYEEADRARDHPARELKEAVRQGRYEEEGWRIRRDGTRFWASVTITAVRDEADRLVGFGKVTRDLTERKRTEDAMREATRLAEAANQTKSEFLAAMSHELRTPLNAIMGYAALLAGEIGGRLEPGQQEHVARISTASRHLLLQIDQILSLARIEAGHEMVNREEVDLSRLAGEVMSLIVPVAEVRGLETRFDAPADPLRIVTDGDKLRQILLNLLSNACKFTERGHVGLRLEPDGESHVLLHVGDTGIGIAPEDHERIFERFMQVDQSRTRTRDGTGLGLAISRELAHLLRGELLVDSAPQRGSTFTLRLPVTPP
jgi:PAS domain S-box-containing protein